MVAMPRWAAKLLLGFQGGKERLDELVPLLEQKLQVVADKPRVFLGANIGHGRRLAGDVFGVQIAQLTCRNALLGDGAREEGEPLERGQETMGVIGR